ncbi:hypothetical protein JCM1841_007079 [Sporobolomyces salmonicolor]
MRLPLHPTSSLLSQLSSSASPSDPPLLFIDHEPFLVELQGTLQLPPGEAEPGTPAPAVGGNALHAMAGARVGNVDLSDPKKPVLRIAHHRLEGRLETLLTPYALLRTTPASDPDPAPSPRDDDDDDRGRRSPKRPRLPAAVSSEADDDAASPPLPPHLALVGLVRKKIVFSKRPEPLLELSSDADPTPTPTPPHDRGGTRPGRATAPEGTRSAG